MRGRIILLILLLLIPTTLAFERPITKHQINCTDNITVKITPTYNTSTYRLVGCTFEKTEGINEWWNCDCNTSIIINQDNPNVSNLYDITYEYWVGNRSNDNNRRTNEVTKFRMGEAPLPVKAANKNVLMIAMWVIGIGILIVVGLGLYFLYSVFIKNADDIDDGKKGIDMTKEHGDEPTPIYNNKNNIDFIKPHTENQIEAILNKYKK